MSASKKRKYNELNIEKRKEVIDLIDSGLSQRSIGNQFGISKSTVANIGKEKGKVLGIWNANCDEERKRKLQRTHNEAVNIKMFEFFVKCRAADIPVTGPMLQIRAKQLALALGLEGFGASNGWLESFLSRNNIHFRLLSGQSAGVNIQAAVDWKRKLPGGAEEYALCDQFNGDESAFWYRQIPRKSLVASDDPCKGGKIAKERLSVLFCCSFTGEKLKPLVIGNAACPRAFKNNNIDPKNLPVTWISNKKAWMTLIDFNNFLERFDKDMRRAGRKVVLYVDNAASHKCIIELTNVKLSFLPPNLTSEVQPLDQGIIQAVKLHYRSKMLQHLVDQVDAGVNKSEFIKSITVLDAVRWIFSAWENVPISTITKCFRRAGFGQDLPENHQAVSGNVNASDVLDPIIATLPRELQAVIGSPQKILNVDENVQVHENLFSSPDEIMNALIADNSSGTSSISDDEETDSSNGTVSTVPSYEEARIHLQELIKFASNHLPQCMEHLFRVDSELEKELYANKVLIQSKISDYYEES